MCSDYEEFLNFYLMGDKYEIVCFDIKPLIPVLDIA